MSEEYGGRDRLRELLDAVLDEDNRSLEDMAQGAHYSPFHFSRQLSRGAGEPPVAMRRRVMLERAGYRIGRGTSVTDAAFEAGYDSVEGFSRAFQRAYGHVPSQADAARSHWLPAPNGIHFHPPTNLWIHTGERAMNSLVDLLLRHDLDDTRHLIDKAKQLDDDDYRGHRRAGQVVTSWEGAEESIAKVLSHQVFTKEVWLAAIEGTELPQHDDDSAAGLLARHEVVAPRWLETVRDVERRGAWEDRIVDALCEPPESFVLSSIVAHVLTYAAHRRQLVRSMLREIGVLEEHNDGDPINWLRREYAGGQL